MPYQVATRKWKKNKPKNGVNSQFKIYSTDPAILNDPNFSNKSNENIGNDLTRTQSNKDLIEALKSKLLDEILPYIKIFIKEELKVSKLIQLTVIQKL